MKRLFLIALLWPTLACAAGTVSFLDGVSGANPNRTVEFTIDHTATSADDHALEIDVDAAGFGDVKAIEIEYVTGALAAGSEEGIILINIDENDATGGTIHAVEVLATSTGSATVQALKVGVGIAVIDQGSGTFDFCDFLCA